MIFEKKCYNTFVRGGEPVCDHDASPRRWIQRSRMLTALADKQLVSSNRTFFVTLTSICLIPNQLNNQYAYKRKTQSHQFSLYLNILIHIC